MEFRIVLLQQQQIQSAATLTAQTYQPLLESRMNRNSFLARIALATMFMSAAGAETSTGGTANAKSEEQIAQEKAEAAAAKKAAQEQAKAEKAEAAAKAKAAKAEATEAAKKAKAEAAEKAKAEKEAANAAKEAAKKEAAEKKAAEKAAKAAEKTKVVMVSQNGVTRPKAGTKTGQVWDLADKLSAEKGAPVAISELMPVASAAGLNDATVRTQYARWKEFFGVYGKVAKAAAPAPTETPAEAVAA
jgi:membrane protein involved in colicin uptake